MCKRALLGAIANGGAGLVAGRIAVVLSCLGFLGLLFRKSMPRAGTWLLFAAVIALSCVEKSSSVLNLVAVERDWVKDTDSVLHGFR